MSAFVFSGRPRIKDKFLIPHLLYDSNNGIVQKSIVNASLVDMPLFWIINEKRKITAMFIIPVYQILMQFKNVVLKVKLELSDIFLSPFVSAKFGPSVEQIFYRKPSFRNSDSNSYRLSHKQSGV